ncbi:hypothetical protein HBH70_120380 [Parastagonospora nodorum]|uniref:Uncharacterized protein n=1 Tax=Phaeosphaeria nodorum (strain SN15 / ATCC MYA-4574 / FGSC 10173) TaxID=321614 RepID=A0A7U2F3X6_PHANO|nr:hypothetical protein HBH51_143310 [Parastagonospora nodorum]QRC98213.1 hypothetical protein JI435_435490 [Parastagonospora nodorum SN15]KAH3989704.1 hypothetical protein HBH52_018310 [Parastagonospora nodorum]KAH4057317.1 hypothetical protein HBH49_044760 [Parastagonospora nodorum]KAH4096037.1 hypothetical protein HBH48_051480 [Parastagonospora nodorum]
MKFLNTAIVVTALVFAMTVQAHCPPEVCNHLKKRTFPWHKNIVESFEANETEVAKIRCRGVYEESGFRFMKLVHRIFELSFQF